MITYCGLDTELDRHRFKEDGIWYCKIAQGTSDEVYAKMKSTIAYVNNEMLFGNYQKKVYKITEDGDTFTLWRSVYSIQNIIQYPKHCEHIAGYPPFRPTIKPSIPAGEKE